MCRNVLTWIVESGTFAAMKTIVYFEDGSIEATTRADELVKRGIARFATQSEKDSYERNFFEDDQRIASVQ